MTAPLAISGKLGIHPGDRVVLLHAPASFELADCPLGASISASRRPPDPPAEMVIAFYTEARALAAEVEVLATSILPSGALWVCWPRRAGGGKSDLTDALVRAFGLATGLVDVKVAALGERWSSLRFVFRLAERDALARRRAEQGR